MSISENGGKRRLVVMLLNTDPRNPEELAAPFYYAAVAAAMDYEVDLLCTATAGRLMFKGIAVALHVKPGDPKTVHDWIKEAHEQGVRLWACPANLDLFDKDEADLIEECDGMMGAATVIQTIMDDNCRVLTF